MSDIKLVSELRKLVPIPIFEAKKLIEKTGGDVEQAVYLYKEKTIKEIMTKTHCTRAEVCEVYELEKLDINRTISILKEKEYDRNYKRIEGIDKHSLLYVRDWLYILESKDFATSLSYKKLDKVIEIFNKIPKLAEVAKELKSVKQHYDTIFTGYTDTAPLDDFIRRNCLLDNNKSFIQANANIPLQIETIKDEIRRHWRNVQEN